MELYPELTVHARWKVFYLDVIRGRLKLSD